MFLCAACVTSLGIARADQTASPANGSIRGQLVVIPGANRESAQPQGVPAAQIRLADSSGGKIIAQTVTAKDGSFSFSALPGTYLVLGPRAKAFARVVSGQTTTVELRQFMR